MTQGMLRRILLGTALTCFGVSGVAMAGPGARECSPFGAWFGVDPETHVLTGWLSTFTGQSSAEGTIDFESPTFDPTLGGLFPTALPGGSDKGAWKRTGGKTFAYSLLGMAVDSSNAIVYIGKTSGTITVLDDCKTLKITAVIAVYLPTDDPFDGAPYFEVDLGDVYAYRLTLP